MLLQMQLAFDPLGIAGAAFERRPRGEHIMSTIEAAIKRRSVLNAIVFVISWGGAFLILAPGGFPPRAEEFESLGALFYIAILAGPCSRSPAV